MILSRLLISAISICGFLFAAGGSGHADSVHEGGWMEKWLSFDPGVFMWEKPAGLEEIGRASCRERV